jgi:hypothetical protein
MIDLTKEFKYCISIDFVTFYRNYHTTNHNDIMDWCIIHLGTNNFVIRWEEGMYVIYLKSEEDLVIFKLRWGHL